MKYLKKRIWQASNIWEQYGGQVPFPSYLKNHFRQHKKYGKKDREEVSRVLYAFLRLGHNYQELGFEKQTILGILLSEWFNEQVEQMLREMSPFELPIDFASKSFIEKIHWYSETYGLDIPENVLPLPNELSNGLDRSSVGINYMRQSPVFLRLIRKAEKVKVSLMESGIDYRELNECCLSLSPDAKLDELPRDCQTNFYVQDWASQNTLDYIQASPNDRWWDVCSGAGGKSLLMLSSTPDIRIKATDIRPAIISSYKNRLAFHGFKADAEVLDVRKKLVFGEEAFDGVLIDAPCSGSGTWGRAPENLHTQQKTNLSDFVSMQKAICSQTVHHLKKGGKLTYVTCSIFKAENEGLSEYIGGALGMNLVKQGIIHSDSYKSDYLFAAEFTKP